MEHGTPDPGFQGDLTPIAHKLRSQKMYTRWSNPNREFLVPFVFRALVFFALAIVVVVTDESWGSSLALAFGAWVLLVTATYNRWFGYRRYALFQARRLCALADAMWVAAVIVFATSWSILGWGLILGGSASWYLAGQYRQDATLQQRSTPRHRSSPRPSRPLATVDADYLSSSSHDRKRGLFWVAVVVIGLGGTAMPAIGLPWYSVVIFLASVWAFIAYLYRDSLRALFDAWTRS